MTWREIRSARPAGKPVPVLKRGTSTGVGARQADLTPSPGRGGYLNECIAPKLLEGVKLRELADMGLPDVWLRAAEAIGYDNFLQLWRILDTAAEHREISRSESESMIEVQLRRFTSFKRYQRNRWIETLASGGMPNAAIQLAVKLQLGEKLDRSHIRRLATRGRMP
jgi:hypothetical protein